MENGLFLWIYGSVVLFIRKILFLQRTGLGPEKECFEPAHIRIVDCLEIEVHFWRTAG